MREIRLLIADTDHRFVKSIGSYLERNSTIRVIGTSDNGKMLLEQIDSLNPDAVLTELVLEGNDGLSVLKTMRMMDCQSRVVVCTDFYNETCIRRARKYGACAFLCKPAYPESLLDAIIESCDESSGGISTDGSMFESQYCADQDAEVGAQLVDMGISQDTEGFRFLCDAVALVRRRPELITSMTKLLYPELARINDTTPQRAERNIRTALKRAYSGGRFSINGRRPTNREMIMYLAGSSLA